MKHIGLIVASLLFFVSMGTAATITKGGLGEQDIHRWDGTAADKTFTRAGSTGGTLTLNSFGDEVDVLISYGGGVAYTQAAIASALTAIGTTNRVTLLLRPGAWAISTPITIPANVTLRMAEGATFTYSGTGAVTGLKEANPEWWGFRTTASAAVNAAALNYAVASSRVVTIPSGAFSVAPGVITISNDNQIIRGQGSSKTNATTTAASTGNTKLTFSDTGTGITCATAIKNPVLEDFDIIMPSGATSIGIDTGTAVYGKIKDVSLVGTGQTGTGLNMGTLAFSWSLESVFIRGFNVGVDATDGNHLLTISNNSEILRDRIGVRIGGGSDGAGNGASNAMAGGIFTGSGFEINFWYDIEIVSATSLNITGNYFESATAAGSGSATTRNIRLSVAGGSSRGIVITGNYFKGAIDHDAVALPAYAISAKTWGNCYINNNYFSTYLTGIVDNQGTTAIAYGNVYRDNDNPGSVAEINSNVGMILVKQYTAAGSLGYWDTTIGKQSRWETPLYGIGLNLYRYETELTVASSATWTNIVPTGCILLAVTATVSTEITLNGGGASVTVGDGTDVDRWGTLSALTVGAANAMQNYADAAIPYVPSAKSVVLTPNAGAFTAGKVKLAVFYLKL